MIDLSANSRLPISESSADINRNKLTSATTIMALNKILRLALRVITPPRTPTIKSTGLELIEFNKMVVIKSSTAISALDTRSPMMRGNDRIPDSPSSSKSLSTFAMCAATPSSEPAAIIHSGGVSSTAKTIDAGSAAKAIT